MRLPLRPLALLLLLAAPAARGQRADELVRWEARVAPVAAGREATLHLTATVAPTWKLYALDSPPPAPALRVTPTLPAGVAVTAGAARHPVPPKTAYDPNFETDVRSFEGRAAVDVPLRVGAAVPAGTYPVGASVRFAICDPSICLPPKTVEVAADLRVTRPTATTRSDAPTVAPGTAPPSAPASPAEPAPTPEAPAVTAPAVTAPAVTAPAVTAPAASPAPVAGASLAAPSRTTAAPSNGIGWGFLLLALGAGLGALLTPCVFPMVPLTVSYFGRHAATRGAAVRMAGLYALAIVGTYTLLGLGLAALVGASGAGALAAHPVVNLLIGLAFVGFGLSLLGLFELRLPAAWVNRVNRAGTASAGAGGALLMGLTLTLVAFSCTVPFVGGLLAVAAQGSWLRPVVGMLVFSVAFAAPFFLFALFPRLLARLPRSGSWMETLKVTLGFVELAAALKFLGQADVLWGAGVVTRPVAIALSAALFGVAGLYLLGLLRFHADAPGAPVGAGRVVGAVGFLGTALYLVPGLWGASLGRRRVPPAPPGHRVHAHGRHRPLGRSGLARRRGRVGDGARGGPHERPARLRRLLRLRLHELPVHGGQRVPRPRRRRPARADGAGPGLHGRPRRGRGAPTRPAPAHRHRRAPHLRRPRPGRPPARPAQRDRLGRALRPLPRRRRPRPLRACRPARRALTATRRRAP